MIPLFTNTIHLSLTEQVLFLLGSLIIGFAIHFLWVNKKGEETALKTTLAKKEKEADQWRLKYYDLEESKLKEVERLSEKIRQWEEKEEMQAIEIEELSLLNQQLLLKQKNASAQQNIYAQEIETNKQYILRLETELTELRSNNNVSAETGNTNEDISSLVAHTLRQELLKFAQQNNLVLNESADQNGKQE
ncbi:MAG: hypothetical protein ACK55K_07435 [Bacteroidota bacterium]